MKKRLRMPKMEGKAKAGFLLVAFVIFWGLPSLAADHSLDLPRDRGQVGNYRPGEFDQDTNGTSGDPIDGEKGPPIDKRPHLIFVEQGYWGDVGGGTMPWTGGAMGPGTGLLSAVLVGVGGVTPFLIFINQR
jgi:hypothetical protein